MKRRDSMQLRLTPFQTRMVLVGRALEVREVAFDALSPMPRLGGVALQTRGPVAIEQVQHLADEASAAVVELGLHPDAFMLLGISSVGMVALYPKEAREAVTLNGALGLDVG